MGIKRNLDQTVECADESLTEVKDPKRAKIDAWLARRQATITAFMQKEPAHTPPRRMTQQTARKSAPPTGAHLYMLKTIEVNQGLDTSESMEKAASSKPSLENQVKALKDQNDQIRKVLKQAIDSLPGRYLSFFVLAYSDKPQ